MSANYREAFSILRREPVKKLSTPSPAALQSNENQGRLPPNENPSINCINGSEDRFVPFRRLRL